MRITGGTLEIIAENQTSNFTITVPAGYALRSGIYVRERRNLAITGGLRIGTTNGGVDVLVALVIGGVAFTIGVPLIKLFSATVDQTLYCQAVTLWNGAAIDLVIPIEKAIL